jgi:hypothetical protein
MLEIATPDMYRINAFRVLGLPVNVSPGDLNKHQKRMKMLANLGADASQAQPAILPLDPSPDADAIRKAGQRLHDPESRIVDSCSGSGRLTTGIARATAGSDQCVRGTLPAPIASGCYSSRMEHIAL